MRLVFSIPTFIAILIAMAIVSPSAQAAAETPACAVEKLAMPLTPDKLQKFLKNSKIKKVEDLICCLPAEYQKNYVVIHSSFAFQAGVPDHPRVILYQPQANNRKTLDMAITFTGDDKSLNGFNNVEVMYNNPTKSEAELYDIDFNQSHKLSDPDPKECLGCHAPNSKDLKTAGVKPIFTEFPWPYTVGTMSTSVLEDKGREYFEKIDAHAKNAIKTQHRYSCIDASSKLVDNTIEFDGLTINLNRRRVAKLILETPDYKRFRPLIVGAGIGCLDGTFDTSEDLKKFENDFSKWMPPAVARSLFRNDDSLSSKYKTVQNLQKAKDDFQKEMINQELAARFERSKQTDIGSKPAIFYPTSSTYLYVNSLSKRDLFNRMSITTLNGFSPPIQLYARYATDTSNQHQVGNGISPLLRFLFEGRGISTLSWSRSMAGGYNTVLDFPIDDLKELTANDPFWKDLGFIGSIDPNSADSRIYEYRKKLCDTLSQQSFRNFSNEVKNPGSSSTGRH